MLQDVDVSLKIAPVGTLVGYTVDSAAGIVQTMPGERGGNLAKRAVFWAMKLVLNAYVKFFRGMSMMAQAMFIYYGFLPMLGISISMQGAAYFILSINTGAHMAETVRGGTLSIDSGQTEGAKAIGTTHVQTTLYAILPQALRSIMSQISNNLVVNIKDSCVLSAIDVTELLHKTETATGALYMNFETYAIVMIIYFVMTFTCFRIFRQRKSRVGGTGNHDLTTTGALARTSGMHRSPDEKDKKKEDARRKETGC